MPQKQFFCSLLGGARPWGAPVRPPVPQAGPAWFVVKASLHVLLQSTNVKHSHPSRGMLLPRTYELAVPEALFVESDFLGEHVINSPRRVMCANSN